MPVQVRPAVPEAASGDNRPFWAIFLCKENSPQKGATEALCLPGELFPFSAGFIAALFSHLAPHSAGARVQRRTRPALR